MNHPASPEARSRLVLGVIGGSGLYEMDALEHVETVEIDTPYGRPSGPFTVGLIKRSEHSAIKVVFVPRHGVGHRFLPGEINYRANVHGLKQLGVTHLVSVSAVGSLREEIRPGHIVLPDQFLDRTRHRASTFFGEGVVAHVQFGEPTCPGLRRSVRQIARALGATTHDGGTCVVMEGPAFSTRAESELYRSWGASVVGMTALPEAKLAREAEIAYVLVALATDYDCWRVDHEEVSVEAVIATLRANVDLAKALVQGIARTLPERVADLPYPKACEHALLTAPQAIGVEVRNRLDLIIGHYL